MSRPSYLNFHGAQQHEGDKPLGNLALFSFIVQSKADQTRYKEEYHILRRAIRDHLSDGLVLDTREKGVLFPIVHFSEDVLSLHRGFTEELPLSESFILNQGIYREVRSICHEADPYNVKKVLPEHIGYILLGFKSVDRNFSQVMVDSWKDWTGARYIYMYLPEELGLSRIRFFIREVPNVLNMFMYVVLVECRSITTRERQMRLLDFTQRMRVERMSGYISVYGITKED